MNRNRTLCTLCLAALISIILIPLFALSASSGKNEPVFLLYSDCVDANTKQGILIREIAKQGLLIAVREKLRMQTWDIVLNGSNIPQKCLTYHIKVSVSSNSNVNISLRKENGGISNVTWSTSFNSSKDEHFDYVQYLQRINALSQTDFIKALEKDGIKGESIKWNAKAILTDSTVNALRKMDYVSNWIALRELDAAVSVNGESSQTLAGNIRGYANLSQLTAFLWNAMDKAFMARALLYSERLVETEHESAWALSHRAYARAFAGFHNLALDDLAAARNKGTGLTDVKESLPEWIDILDAYCRYDHGKLLEIADGRIDNELAQFLYALEIQHYGCNTTKIEELRKVLKRIPKCFRVHDILSSIGGVSNGHIATTLGPTIFSRDINSDLIGIIGLPTETKALLDMSVGGKIPSNAKSHLVSQRNSDTGFDDAEFRTNLIRNLFSYSCKSGNDTSWAILAKMIQNTTFVQIERRIRFMKKCWGVPVDQFLNLVKPYILDHPYGAHIESYGLDPKRNNKEYRELMNKMNYVDEKLTMVPMMNDAWQVGGNASGVAAFMKAFENSDAIAGDLEDGITMFCLENNFSWEKVGTKQALVQRAKMLKKVSPYSPVTVASLIVNDWANSKKEIPEWEKGYLNNPLVIKQFAIKYAELKDYAKAERFLRICVGKYPEEWAYTKLADVYKNQNKMDQWLSVLEEFLARPDYGLGHASVRVQIANYFMDKREWKKAEPYALAAANTWAAWAMMCACKCYERMEDWSNAELWVQRTAERYENSIANWYFWCKRTGHGNVKDAFNLLSDKLSLMETSQNREDKSRAAVIHLLQGEKRKACSIFQEVFYKDSNLYNGLHSILIARELKDDVAHDKLLKEFKEKGKTVKDNAKLHLCYVDLLTAYCSLLKDTSEIAFDKAVEECLKKAVDLKKNDMTKSNQSNLLYFAGKMMELTEKNDLATKYYKRCLEMNCQNLWNYILAGAALHK